MSDKPFFDTNIVVYLLSEDTRKANLSEQLVAGGGIISVQVLNEFASVGARKLGLTQQEVKDVLAAVRGTCEVFPLTVELHDIGMGLIDRYGFSVYDSMVVAAAIASGATTLYGEDMQDGLVVDDCVKIVNPYAVH